MKSARYSSHVSIKFEFSMQILEKFSNVKFQGNPSGGSQVVPCGRKDRRDNVAFRNFPNVSARGNILKKINGKIKE
jgi:hypothetical protein